MTRSMKRALLPPTLAATAVLAVGCGFGSSSSTQALRPAGEASTAAGSTAPIDLKPIGAGTPLEPATYAMPLLGDDSAARAIVDVPDGYFSSGGWVIDDGHGTLAPDEYGNLTFFGAVDRLDSDPCSPHGEMRPGSGVGDLAEALAHQRHRVTTRPEPVTLGGHHGLYVESRAARGSDHCEHDLLRARAADSMWLSDDLPGTTDRFWIVDVNGRRVVAVVQTMRGRTGDPAELVGIARSARFTHVGNVGRPFRPGP